MATSGETTSSLFAVNRDSACAVRNKKGKLKGREEEPTSSVRFQTSPLIWSKLENSIVGIQHVKQQTEQIPSLSVQEEWRGVVFAAADDAQ